MTRQEKIEYIKAKQALEKRKSSRNEIYEAYRLFKGRYAILIGGSGCVDCDTEYFNGKAWVKISEYDGENVLQYNENDNAELVKPLTYHKYPCDILTHFNTKYGVDQCLSDEHNVVYLTSKGNIAKKAFKDVKESHLNTSKGFSGRFITTYSYNGTGISLNEYELRLMIAVIADGSFQIDNNRCRFNLKKERKQKRLEWLFEQCKIEYVKTKSTNEGFYFYYANVPMHLKSFPDEWYNCSQEQLKIIADESLYWDGSMCNNRKSFSTTIKKDADFMQFVYSACGMRSTISIGNRLGKDYITGNKTYQRKSIEYTVIIAGNKTVGISNNIIKNEMKPYKTIDGYKYCFTVPSGMLILRRNGKIFITGNSGKSYEAADKHLDRIVTEDDHRILCCRAEYKQISASQIPLLEDRIKKRYSESYNNKLWKINKAQGHESITYLPNGNCFLFWGLDDPEKLKSIFDITSIWAEEADQIRDKDLRELERRLRGYQGINKNGTEKYMQITFSFNPVHETSWVKGLFFDNKEDNQLMLCGKFPFEDCIDYKKVVLPDFDEKIMVWDELSQKNVSRYKVNTLVIHSTFRDNKFIDSGYPLTLKKQHSSSPEEFNVYANGQWGVYGNHFFKEFRRDIHIIEPFVIPDWWIKYTSKDYGLDMLANLWIAIDTQGNAYIYKELHESDLIISDAARRIKEVNGNDVIRIKYAPPDFNKRDQKSGKTWFSLFREYGESLVESSNKREEGWLAIKEWLKVFETKDEVTGEKINTSKLKIFSNCKNLIRCLPQLKQCEDNPNDVDNQPHEITHAPDALRGFCIMRQSKSIKPEEPRPCNFDHEKPEQEEFIGIIVDESYMNY